MLLFARGRGKKLKNNSSFVESAENARPGLKWVTESIPRVKRWLGSKQIPFFWVFKNFNFCRSGPVNLKIAIFGVSVLCPITSDRAEI